MTKVDIAVLLEPDADKLPDRHFTITGDVVTEASGADSDPTPALPESEQQSVPSTESAGLKR